MRIVRAEVMGLCFGVRDALDTAFWRNDPERITIHGELVHNELVQERLRARGFALTDEAQRDGVPDREAVLITAHGVSDRERERLRGLDKTLIDTTCPLVRRAHDTARRLAAAGRFVIVIGKPGHVEVEGLIGDLPSCAVVPDEQSVTIYPSERLGVICQTTCTEDRAATVLAAIRRANPAADVVFVDTACEPTKQRIRAARTLAAATDVVVIVGGANSNNTRELANLVRSLGTPAHHVAGPDALRAEWFRPRDVVGLTAGTSTLDETVDAVEQRLRSLADADCVTRQ